MRWRGKTIMFNWIIYRERKKVGKFTRNAAAAHTTTSENWEAKKEPNESWESGKWILVSRHDSLYPTFLFFHSSKAVAMQPIVRTKGKHPWKAKNITLLQYTVTENWERERFSSGRTRRAARLLTVRHLLEIAQVYSTFLSFPYILYYRRLAWYCSYVIYIFL